MLIDARRSSLETIQAGVCIVGTGMGGASVAKKLIEAGLDVLFVEAGGEEPSRGAPPIQHQVLGRSFGLPLTRAMEIGGSTNLWHGICAAFDPIDFSTRSWIANSGWPISHGDLKPYYTEARRWLGVTPTDPEAMEVAADVENVLTAKSFWTCRTPARMKDAVLSWVEARQARCLIHATALEFRADASGTVRSLVVGCGDRTIEVRADVFIAAAGGLETPRLLLNSGRSSAQGFGEGAPLIGRYLMDHPTGYFSQAVFCKAQSSFFGSPTLVGAGGMLGFSVRPDLQRRFGLPNHYVFLRPGASSAKVPNDLLRQFLGVRGVTGLSMRHLRTLLLSPYVRQRILRERFGIHTATRYGDLYVMAEQVPNPDSRVALSDDMRDGFGYPVATVDWRVTPDEWDHFSRYSALVAEGIGLDARVASVRLDQSKDWLQVMSSAAHHMGTARMAATPRRGVVDANLRVFGCSNLFVCDASVFPTASGTNPSLTISALALRLGGHLAQRLAADVVVQTVLTSVQERRRAPHRAGLWRRCRQPDVKPRTHRSA